MTLANVQDDRLRHFLQLVDTGTQRAIEIGYIRGYNSDPDGPEYSIPHRYFRYFDEEGAHFSPSQFSYDYGTSLTATAYKASTTSNDGSCGSATRSTATSSATSSRTPPSGWWSGRSRPTLPARSTAAPTASTSTT
jgi:hypothetical protein